MAVVVCIMRMSMSAPAPDSAGLWGGPGGGAHVTQIHLLKHLYVQEHHKVRELA